MYCDVMEENACFFLLNMTSFLLIQLFSHYQMVQHLKEMFCSADFKNLILFIIPIFGHPVYSSHFSNFDAPSYLRSSFQTFDILRITIQEVLYGIICLGFVQCAQPFFFLDDVKNFLLTSGLGYNFLSFSYAQ